MYIPERVGPEIVGLGISGSVVISPEVARL